MRLYNICSCVLISDGINALRGELHLSELNGIDRISLVLISPWSNLNLYIMSILETVCLPLLLEIRA